MKLVREHISFKKHTDPKASLGVGYKDLIKTWLNEYKIRNYVINDDLTIDVKGSVHLDYKNLSLVPDYIKFNIVEGNFYCDNNELISLEFCPIEVKGSFFCNRNKLTSLKGCPQYVGDIFSCSFNQLSSLEFCPKIVNENFYCMGNLKKFTIEDVLSRCKVKIIHL